MIYSNNIRGFSIEYPPGHRGMAVAPMQGEGKENGFIFNIKE